jgi:hypothetical protein
MNDSLHHQAEPPPNSRHSTWAIVLGQCLAELGRRCCPGPLFRTVFGPNIHRPVYSLRFLLNPDISVPRPQSDTGFRLSLKFLGPQDKDFTNHACCLASFCIRYSATCPEHFVISHPCLGTKTPQAHLTSHAHVRHELFKCPCLAWLHRLGSAASVSVDFSRLDRLVGSITSPHVLGLLDLGRLIRLLRCRLAIFRRQS